ncbi:hypothetical protein G3U99_12630 [Vibrio coralliilyticus OCN008]|uniref:hypothetical protein n=1 Tax=Vibrio coralliilyticus TaxID=190893 RepID=UPI00039178D1|nr:hypothetical protein [Vibrio coralliilyticus]ERB65538.1 hypothetical protein N779_09475 [Vibrio coralliilyticus OCN008]QIJ85050.1 hypothetical protein G3U99_12630 [Vibrio coralliilyticus OCN008]
MKNKSKKGENLVDFGFFNFAKQFYEAAKLIKASEYGQRPYYVNLSFSIELFLKSIRTSTIWSEYNSAEDVEYLSGHSLSKIFDSLERKHPKDTKYLEERYFSKYHRSLKGDLKLNSDVFYKQRYPYLKDPVIPSMPVDVDLLNPVYDNDIAVYPHELEMVATFLHDELIVHFTDLNFKSVY